MAEKNDKKKRRKGPNLRRQARRDVRVATQPLLRQIGREEGRARRDYRQDEARVGDIYDALLSELGGLNPGAAIGGISDQFTQDIGSLTNLIGSSGPAGEGAAAAGYLGSLGAGGLQTLAGDASRNVAYNQSTQRQGSLERATTQRNMLTDMQDLIREIQDRRFDIKADMGPQILARIDELRRGRREFGLAEKEYALRKEMTQKGFRREGKWHGEERRDEKRLRDEVTDQVSDEQLRTRLQRTKKRLAKGRGRLSELDTYYPGEGFVKQDGQWGYMQPEGPNTHWVALPQVTRVKKRQSKLRRRKRRLRRKIND